MPLPGFFAPVFTPGFIPVSRLLLAALATCWAMPALAHDGAHAAGFAAGLAHPLSGLDHLLAMLAVGIWAAQHQRAARWILPLAFPLAMAAGAWWGATGAESLVVETGIAGSVAALGLLITFAVRVPAAAGVAVVALFGAMHGYAHGVAMPQQAAVFGAVFGYGAGFIVGTMVLHLGGLAIGMAARGIAAARFLQAGGAAMTAAGMVMLAAVA